MSKIPGLMFQTSIEFSDIKDLIKMQISLIKQFVYIKIHFVVLKKNYILKSFVFSSISLSNIFKKKKKK